MFWPGLGVNGFSARFLRRLTLRRRSQPNEKNAGKAAVPGPAFARREGHLIGYARVSTAGQNTTTQEAKFQAGGCTLIRTETVSGHPE